MAWKDVQMRWIALVGVLTASLASGGAKDEEPAVKFRDTFRPKLADGWTWLREDPDAWRIGEGGLEVLIQPGNMWGPANDAKNVLLRPAPDPGQSPVEVTAAVENKPTGQWEQVDLIWYYDDAHMVKLGQEMVDGQLSVVMGREQADQTQTIAIIPLESERVELRLEVSGAKIKGRFKTPDGEWRDAGECEVSAVEGKSPQVSLQFYMGPPDAEHWARVSEVTIRTGEDAERPAD